MDLLKLFAFLSMFVDHFNKIFDIYSLDLFLIGRIAFPAFAFLLAYKYIHYANNNKILYRLLIVASISQIPFVYFLELSFYNLNIFFTLFFGLLLYNYKFTSVLTFAVIFVFLQVNGITVFDYGISGVLLIYFCCFYFEINSLTDRLFYLTAIIVCLGFVTNFTSFVLLIVFFTLLVFYFFLYFDFDLYFMRSKFWYLVYPLHILIFGFSRMALF